LKDINNVGGGRLLSFVYNSSPSQLLSAVYPEYEWLPWKFAKCPGNIWSEDKNKRHFIEWAGKELGLNDVNEWHTVSTKHLIKLGVDTEVPLPQLLSTVYPEFNWDVNAKPKTAFYKKTQYLLKGMLKIMFPQQGKEFIVFVLTLLCRVSRRV
jgi:hypothetical protein